MTMFEGLSLLGVGVFAASGALTAGRRGFDLLGVVVIAFVTALGGGTIRDILLDRYPIFWVKDPKPLFVALIASGLTLTLVRYRRPPLTTLRVADALGLALFSISGAQLAETQSLPNIIVILMGTITGSAGGVIRDVLSGEVPLLLRDGDLYATASIAGISTYLVLKWLGIEPTSAGLAGMATVAAIRCAAIRWNLRVPVFHLPDEPGRPE